ncbi:MAG: DUF885 domain-containing protein [Candidatus Riflebacteria bacterium]|nr:DUF885 domain-containing protein [Candidatus Riflebacteria bacterium]
MRRIPLYKHQGFEKLSNHYYSEILRRNPIAATWIGEHSYDSLLPETGAEAVEKEIAFFREFRDAFSALPERELTIDERIDRKVVQQIASKELFMLEDARRWRLGRDLVRTLGDAIFILFTRDFAPLSQRIESIITRLKASPMFLQEGKSLFQDVPEFWCEIFLQSCDGFIGLIKTIEKNIKGHVSANLFKSFEISAKTAIGAVQAHSHWFKHAVAPYAHGKWSMGKGPFDALLAIRELGMSSSEILELGNQSLQKTRERLSGLAKQISPSGTIEETSQKIQAHSPSTFERVLEAYQEAVARSRVFVEQSGFATLPPNEALEVMETPSYMAHLIPFAAYCQPEKTSKTQKGIYLVTRPPENELKKRHSYAEITNTSIHEGYPGHHLHFSAQNLHPGKMRIFADSIELIEGWAHYCEEETKRMGFEASDENLFMQTKDEAWRAARVLIDINTHSGSWNLDKAVDFLVETVGIPKSAALAELSWYSQLPGYPLSYLTGKHLLYNLREEMRASFGRDFTHRDFHDIVLNEGSLPIFIAREYYPEILKENLQSIGA